MKQKPFYKKCWFWLIVICAIFAVAGNSTDDEADQSNEAPKLEAKKSAVKTKEDKREVAQNEEANYSNVILKVDETRWLEPDEFSDVQNGEKILAVKVTIKNTGSKRLSYSMFDFKLNSDGKSKEADWILPTQYEDMEAEKLDDGELEKDAEATGWIIFPANENANNIKLEYFKNIFDENPSITVNLK